MIIHLKFDQKIVDSGAIGIKEQDLETVEKQTVIFAQVLNQIFLWHRMIPKLYPVGSLGFSVNGKRPSSMTIMNDGDIIEFYDYK